MPEVSVIIPTYNSARYLQAAVDSVLAQSFRDFEVLVIDDESTDETEMVMRRYGLPVRYVRQQHSGVAVARNHGIEESQGRYVAFLDADDTWFPHKLARQLTALGQHPLYRFCYAAYITVDSELAPISVHRSERRGSALEDLLTRGNVVGSICTVLCERSLFSAVGGFDSSFSQCADWEMWVRLAALTEFLYVDEPLVTYRQHEANMSCDVQLLEEESVRVLERGFALPGLPNALRAQRGAAFARNYMVVSGSYFHARGYRKSVQCAARAIATDIRQVFYLIAFPIRLASRLRGHHVGETA